MLKENNLILALEKLINEYELLEEECKQLIMPLSQNQLNWRLSERKWSIADCISHLIYSGNAYLCSVQNALKNNEFEYSSDSGLNNLSLMGKLFIWLIEPPPKIKLKTFSALNGRTITNKDDLLIDYIALQKRYIAFINKSEGIDLSKIKVPSPVSHLFKFRVNDILFLIAAHNRRHFWQAWDVMGNERFPRE